MTRPPSPRAVIRALLLSIAVVALASTPVASADRREDEARELFKAGNRLMKAGDYAGALDSFARAYEVWPNPKILLNKGTALLALARRAEAAEAWERYTNDPGADPGKRREVLAEVARLDLEIGKLRISASAPFSRLRVDGRLLGPRGSDRREGAEGGPEVPDRGELWIVRVEPGEHVVIGEGLGEPTVRTVAVAAGQIVDVVLEPRLTAIAPAPDPTPPAGGTDGTTSTTSTVPQAQPGPLAAPVEVGRRSAPAGAVDASGGARRGAGRRRVGVAVGGVGAAGVAIGATFGLLARASWQEVEDRCALVEGEAGSPDGYLACDREGVASSDEARARARVANVAFGIGVPAAVLGAVLYLTAPAGGGRSVTAGVVPAAGGGVSLVIEGAY